MDDSSRKIHVHRWSPHHIRSPHLHINIRSNLCDKCRLYQHHIRDNHCILNCSPHLALFVIREFCSRFLHIENYHWIPFVLSWSFSFLSQMHTYIQSSLRRWSSNVSTFLVHYNWLPRKNISSFECITCWTVFMHSGLMIYLHKSYNYNYIYFFLVE